MAQIISPLAYIGSIHLAVTNLERTLTFYQKGLGFSLDEKTDTRAVLSADPASGRPMIFLSALPGGRRSTVVRRTTGLYHLAILVPSRLELARTLQHIANEELPIQGVADHGVSESLYLADPDGNGIEIYHDLPRQQWPVDATGKLDMVTDELDLDGLLEELNESKQAWTGIHPATVIGHVHLHVADLALAIKFYTEGLGLTLTQRIGPGAAFLAAGTYHHHVGINTWAGVGAPKPQPTSPGLRWFSLALPDQAALEQVKTALQQAAIAVEEQPAGLLARDPSGNGVLLTCTGTDLL